MRLAEVSDRSGVVPFAWTAITKNLSTNALLALAAAIRERDIDPSDTAAVADVWHQMTVTAKARVLALKQEAAEDRTAYLARSAARTAELERLSGIVTAA